MDTGILLRSHLLIILGLIGFYCQVSGQQSERLTIIKAGIFTPDPNQADPEVMVLHREAPAPGGMDYQSMLRTKKQEMSRKYPAKAGKIARNRTPLVSDTLPVQKDGFEGNASGSSTPNDNSLAISNGGYLISAINTTLHFYDLNNDTLLYNKSLSVFMLPTTITGSKYDPKVIYDNEANRFILVFLNGSSASTSSIVTCFSSSENPMDPWHIYVVEGNPFNDTSWTDYPALALNKTDLFITGNLILSQSGVSWQAGFKQTLIWQIHKQDGYDGLDSLRMMLHSDINYDNRRIRNLHPVMSGRGIYDTDQYFLSNRNFSTGSDSIFVVRIDGDFLTGGGNLTIDDVTSDRQYHLAVNAPQADGQELATNDTRVLGAVKEQDIIHFVGNTTDTATGTAAIYHGRLDLNTQGVTMHIHSDSVLNYGYPNIAHQGINWGEEACIITYEYSSTVHNPGLACIYYDNNGIHHQPVYLRTGDSTINMLGGLEERWGDYMGIQRKYDEPCTVWCAGTFGNTARKNATWISKVAVSDTCSDLPYTLSVSEQRSDESLLKAYPNPASQKVTLEFISTSDAMISAVIYDLYGRQVALLVKDRFRQGFNVLEFNAGFLPQGTYILRIEPESGKYLSKKLIVVH
jgi:hypothetical protein